MATVYGETTNHWRAYMTYTVTNNASNVVITVSAAGMQSVGWGFRISYNAISTTVSCSASTNTVSGSGNFTSTNGATVSTSYAQATYTINKTTSAQAVTLTAVTKNQSGYMDGTSTASVVIDIPALTGYTVSYNANGGSGAPSNQTKWYGQTLTLSGTVPTRSGYTFLGWNTSSTATTASYQPSASYTTNAALSLYAVWSRNYISPTISNLTAYRCNSSGTAADEGTYARVTGTWTVDTSINSSNKSTKVVTYYKLTTATSWTTGNTTTVSATSGSIAVTIGGGGLAVGNAYDIKVTVFDSGGDGSAQTIITKSFFTMDIGNSGKSIGFGCAASDSTDGIDLAMPLRFTGSSVTGLKLRRTAVVGQSSSTNTNPWYKFASISVSSAYQDESITFHVSTGYADAVTKVGILTAHIRTDTSGYLDNAQLKWEYAGSGINTTHFVLAYNTGANPTIIELWVFVDSPWQHYHFDVINETNRITSRNTKAWTLYNTSSAGSQSAITSGLTQKQSTYVQLNNPVADKGTSGIWTYEKYYDGTAVCYGTHTVSSTSLTAYGSGYYQTISVAFPFTFTAIPQIWGSVRSTYGLWGVSFEAGTTTSNCGAQIFSFGSNSGQVAYVNILARGRWK